MANKIMDGNYDEKKGTNDSEHTTSTWIPLENPGCLLSNA